VRAHSDKQFTLPFRRHLDQCRAAAT
jgi:hypothetical protein